MGLMETEAQKLRDEIKTLEVVLKVKQHSLRELLSKSRDDILILDDSADTEYVSVNEASEILKASTKSIRSWIKTHAVRSKLAPRGKVYHLEDLKDIANNAIGRQRLGLTAD